MKKGKIIVTFMAMHIGFIFLQIHKHMRCIKLSFEKQKNEKLLAQLEKEKQELHNQLYALQNRAAIKEFAQEKLHLKTVSIDQIKRLPHD
jgi:cell division protein FtsB